MSHYYRVPLVGAGTDDDPASPEGHDDVDVDAAAYRRHHVAGQYAVYASAVEIEAFAGLEVDGDEYPVTAPDYDDAGDDEYVCDECGRAFDSPQGLSAHSQVHQ